MSTSTIGAFFESALKNWADSQSPVIPIAFENEHFEKPSTGNFIECFLLPNETINPTVNGLRKREIGIFQVNVWTRQGYGTQAAMSIAQGIIDLFPLVPKGAVSIEKTPSIEKGLNDPSGWYVLPVTIYYRLES
jgi:hypothetical protein